METISKISFPAFQRYFTINGSSRSEVSPYTSTRIPSPIRNVELLLPNSTRCSSFTSCMANSLISPSASRVYTAWMSGPAVPVMQVEATTTAWLALLQEVRLLQDGEVDLVVLAI